MTIMNGGIRLSDEFQTKGSDAAFKFFMNNLKQCSILTDSSISCVTFICEINPNVASPYTAMRSTNFNIPVNKLLLKLFLHEEMKHPSSKNSSQSLDHHTSYVYFDARQIDSQTQTTTTNADFEDNVYDNKSISINKEINKYNNKKEIKDLLKMGKITKKELTPEFVLQNEIDIQQTLYKQSFKDELTPCEPICPCIVHYVFNIEKKKMSLYENMSFKFVQKYPGDLNLLKKLFRYKLSFIVMELLEGFETLHDIKYNPIYSDEEKRMYISIAAWEFSRLCSSYGVEHNDAHSGNVMINPNDTSYFNNKKVKGRAIIIDFGRSTVQKQTTNPKKKYDINDYYNMLSCGNKSDWGNRSFSKLNITEPLFTNKEVVQMLNKFEQYNSLRTTVATKFLKTFNKQYNMTFHEACELMFPKKHNIEEGHYGGQKMIKLYNIKLNRKTSTRKSKNKSKNKSTCKSTSKNKNKSTCKSKNKNKNKSKSKNKNKNKSN